MTSRIVASPAGFDHHDAAADLFLSDQIDTCERLSKPEAHSAVERVAVKLATTQVECACGDPELGRQELAALLAGELVIPRRSWRAILVGAIAALHLDADAEAERLLHSALANASARDTPGVRDRAEAWAIASLTGESMASSACRTRAKCHVEIFGKFTVTINGSVLNVPRGRPRTLLKLLVLSEGSVPIDTVTDTLWPREDGDLGRQRLRNILARLRARFGPVVERDGPMLRLIRDEISSDYGRWAEQARAQHLSEDRAALDRLIVSAPSELSSEDRYEEWFHPFERRYRIELLRLIDGRIEAAIADSDTRTALAMYHRSLDVDPHAADRIDSAVALAASAGLPDDAATFERRRTAIQAQEPIGLSQ